MELEAGCNTDCGWRGWANLRWEFLLASSWQHGADFFF